MIVAGASIRHVIVLMAEEVSAEDVPALADESTECLAYHLTPRGEDRAAIWDRYGADLRRSGFSFAQRSAEQLILEVRNRCLADVTIVDAGVRDVTRIARAVDGCAATRDDTLLAIALGGGASDEVESEHGALGSPGILMLRSGRTPGGWVSEEVFDHTSLLQLCEVWTADRGHKVSATGIASWRRELCGDLGWVLRSDSEGLSLPSAPGRRLAHPTPYFPTADLRLREGNAILRLSNLGPVATRSAPFTVTDGSLTHRLVIPPSAPDAQHNVRLPVQMRDEGYDVTVRGPDHFHRRFAGRLPDVGVYCAEDRGGRDPWFPAITLDVWHDHNLPIFFWMHRKLGDRAASKAAGYGSGTLERLPGPRQTARFKEEPGANTFGWYDIDVTTSADPAWVREYAGHLPTGTRPSLGY